MHSSPSKGKAREDAHWQLGWWELYPLVDGPRRPLVWSGSSVIYTAHPSQPVVVARHFPSNRHFFLPLPPPIASSPVSFEPPTVIRVSPEDDWLFAFTPSREVPGVGCIYRKGYQIDSWTPNEWWNFAKGAGVVCAEWMFAQRPANPAPHRLPPKGPTIPMNNPTLLLVTETHFLHFGMAQQGGSPPPKPGQPEHPQPQANEAEKNNDMNPKMSSAGNGGRRVCVHAAIGFSYNEPHFVIAMRSKAPRYFRYWSPSDSVNDASADWEHGAKTPLSILLSSNLTSRIHNFFGRKTNTADLQAWISTRDMKFLPVPPELPWHLRQFLEILDGLARSGKVATTKALCILSALPKSEITLYAVGISQPAPGRTLDNQWIVRMRRPGRSTKAHLHSSNLDLREARCWGFLTLLEILLDGQEERDPHREYLCASTSGFE
ncbi:hypothetical protein BC629DRAFT_1589704 [Irpex lacteus]|nr:hypothetical protein BC629DRAFT_1589704 [Irpex lacteus]